MLICVILVQASSLLNIPWCEHVIMHLPILMLMELQTTLLGIVLITSPWAPVGRILQGIFWGAEMLGHRGCISSTLVGLLDNDPKRLHQFILPWIHFYETSVF